MFIWVFFDTSKFWHKIASLEKKNNNMCLKSVTMLTCNQGKIRRTYPIRTSGSLPTFSVLVCRSCRPTCRSNALSMESKAFRMCG